MRPTGHSSWSHVPSVRRSGGGRGRRTAPGRNPGPRHGRRGVVRCRPAGPRRRRRRLRTTTTTRGSSRRRAAASARRLDVDDRGAAGFSAVGCREQIGAVRAQPRAVGVERIRDTVLAWRLDLRRRIELRAADLRDADVVMDVGQSRFRRSRPRLIRLPRANVEAVHRCVPHGPQHVVGRHLLERVALHVRPPGMTGDRRVTSATPRARRRCRRRRARRHPTRRRGRRSDLRQDRRPSCDRSRAVARRRGGTRCRRSSSPGRPRRAPRVRARRFRHRHRSGRRGFARRRRHGAGRRRRTRPEPRRRSFPGRRRRRRRRRIRRIGPVGTAQHSGARHDGGHGRCRHDHGEGATSIGSGSGTHRSQVDVRFRDQVRRVAQGVREPLVERHDVASSAGRPGAGRGFAQEVRQSAVRLRARGS